jgi:putative ABC transport system permease protein
MAERLREIATLKAIGYTSREVASFFLSESLIVNMAGIVPGLLLGQGLMNAMARAFQNDIFSMPSRIAVLSFLWTVVLCIVFVFLAHAVVARRIRRLSWVEELGSKE